MTNLKNLLFENIQNILMACCQVRDRCPLGYLFEISYMIPHEEIADLNFY